MHRQLAHDYSSCAVISIPFKEGICWSRMISWQSPLEAEVKCLHGGICEVGVKMAFELPFEH